MKNHEVAEVFGGAVGKGFWYLGYMKSKEDYRITDRDLGAKTIKFGESIGSQIAAILSSGKSYDEVYDFFVQNAKLTKNVLKISVPQEIRNRSLEELSCAFVGKNTKFGDLPDLNVLVTDITGYKRRKPLVLNYKTAPDVPVYLGLKASSSVPIVFSPVKVKINGKERVLVDGGISRYNLISEALREESVKNIISTEFWDSGNIEFWKALYFDLIHSIDIPRELEEYKEFDESQFPDKRIFRILPKISNGHILDSSLKGIRNLARQGKQDFDGFNQEHPEIFLEVA